MAKQVILGISEHGKPEYEYGFYDDNVSIQVQVDEQGRGIMVD